MKKGLVVYRSKYGATRKYADMLREELNCDVLESGSCRDIPAEEYDWFVFAGGIYAGGLSGLETLRKNYARLKNKKIAVFCVGASPFDEKALEEIKARNLRNELKDIPLFYGRGAWDESKMSWKDRTLCRILQKAVAGKKADALEPWMKALLSSAGQRRDWTDSGYLAPLLEYLRAGR